MLKNQQRLPGVEGHCLTAAPCLLRSPKSSMHILVDSTHHPGGDLGSKLFWSLSRRAGCTDFEPRVLMVSRLVSKLCSGSLSHPSSILLGPGHYFFPGEPFRDVGLGEQYLVSSRQTRPVHIAQPLTRTQHIIQHYFHPHEDAFY